MQPLLHGLLITFLNHTSKESEPSQNKIINSFSLLKLQRKQLLVAKLVVFLALRNGQRLVTQRGATSASLSRTTESSGTFFL